MHDRDRGRRSEARCAAAQPLRERPHAAALECAQDSAKDLAQLIDAELRAETLDDRTRGEGASRLLARPGSAYVALGDRQSSALCAGCRHGDSRAIAAIVADASSVAVDAAVNGAFEGDLARSRRNGRARVLGRRRLQYVARSGASPCNVAASRQTRRRRRPIRDRWLRRRLSPRRGVRPACSCLDVGKARSQHCGD